MLIEDQNPHNKSIMVSLLGIPNAGKSSLANYLLGTDLSIVSNKPQTTRNRIHCVLTVDHTEIVLVDTPGIHKSGQELNKRLNEQATIGNDRVDLNLILVDVTKGIADQLLLLQSTLGENLGRSILVFNKVDTLTMSDGAEYNGIFVKACEIFKNLEGYVSISATSGHGIHNLTGMICDRAVSSPHHYDDGSISNKSLRFFASEYIRESATSLLRDEIPHELAVVIDEYKDLRSEQSIGQKKQIDSHISATIVVNRPSQRGIVVGAKGSMIREIGIRARKKIEVMVGGQVHLNLHVKVLPKWYNNNFILEEIGLPRAENSSRVWRKK